MPTPRRWLLPFALLLAAPLLFAACGDDDDGGTSTTPPANATEDGDASPEASTTPGGDDGTPADGGETPAGEGTPGTDSGPASDLTLEADVDPAWYVFDLTPAMLDNRESLIAEADAAAAESELDAGIIRTQAGRFADRTFDGVSMIFLDPADELGLPLMDVRWCVPASENPHDPSVIVANLQQRGAVVVDAGSVSYDGGASPMYMYTREVQPGLDFYVTYVPSGDCWVEVLLTVRQGDTTQVEAMRTFVSSISLS